jgi:hypothetical protein
MTQFTRFRVGALAIVKLRIATKVPEALFLIRVGIQKSLRLLLRALAEVKSGPQAAMPGALMELYLGAFPFEQ